MSRLDSFLAGFGFRSSTPSFEAGDEIASFVTGIRDGRAVVRIGDTELLLDGVDAPGALVDERIRLRVESFDEGTNTGEATFLSVVAGRGI